MNQIICGISRTHVFLNFRETLLTRFYPPLNRRAPRQSIDMGHIGKAMWGTSVYLLLRIFCRPPFFLSRFGALPVCLEPRLGEF